MTGNIKWKCLKCKKEMDDVEWEEHKNSHDKEIVKVKCDCHPDKFLRFADIQEELSKE